MQATKGPTEWWSSCQVHIASDSSSNMVGQRFGCSWTKVYTGCRPQRVLRNGDPPVRSTSRLTSMASPQQYPPRRGSTFFVIIHYPDLTPPREWVIWNPSRQSQLSAPIISCVGLFKHKVIWSKIWSTRLRIHQKFNQLEEYIVRLPVASF